MLCKKQKLVEIDLFNYFKELLKEMRRCNRCIMDDVADKYIVFDEAGYCNYCSNTLKQLGTVYFPNVEGEGRLKNLISEIKAQGKNKKYDCIMGISGGLDSSYLAYLGHLWGVRVLAVHIDDGYDTEISKNNIKKLIDKTGFDFEVITPDAEQFNDLTLAYMKAGVPNIAIPQDNILNAFLYQKVKEYNIGYFLSGDNFALECIMQKGNTYKSRDVVNLKDIHNRFGRKPISNLLFMSTLQKEIMELFHTVKKVTPLNLVDYNRERAFRELNDFCGFEYYGGKHLENILTAFIQLYWFPKKFGVDKRKSHLSSMIVSGQMTREQALEEMQKPLYEEKQMEQYMSFIKDKLGVSDEEFSNLLNVEPHQHQDYAIEDDTITYRIIRALYKLVH